MSGRREPQVHEDARLIGQSSYIYEAGCALVVDGEKTLLTGELKPTEEATSTSRSSVGRARPPVRGLSRGGSSITPRGTTAASSPICSGARSTSARRTAARASTATGICGCSTTARSAPDAGHRGRPRLPPGSARGQQGGGGRRHMRARGYAPEECIAVGDSVEDLEVADAVGRFFVVANGPERDPGLRAAIGAGERDSHRGPDRRRLLRGGRRFADGGADDPQEPAASAQVLLDLTRRRAAPGRASGGCHGRGCPAAGVPGASGFPGGIPPCPGLRPGSLGRRRIRGSGGGGWLPPRRHRRCRSAGSAGYRCCRDRDCRCPGCLAGAKCRRGPRSPGPSRGAWESA